MSTRMRTRSQIPNDERDLENERSKTMIIEKKVLPMLEYEGKNHYYTSFEDVACACDLLLNKANKSEKDLIVGFDLEWPFNFQTGSGKVAVMQISPDLDNCYIFHFSAFAGKGLPKILLEFCMHPKVKLSGVNIKNDIRKLSRDFKGVLADEIINNCIELSTLANTMLPFQRRWSMEALVNHFMNKQINKDRKVRMSKWNMFPLTPEQQTYAAIDAYASLDLYFIIKGYKFDEDKENDLSKMVFI